MSEKLLFAKIIGVHGIKGFVKIQSFANSPESLFQYGPLSNEKGDQTYVLTLKNYKKNIAIVEIKGITNRNDAEALKGVKLYLDAALLPDTEEDEYYHKDLKGLDVFDPEENHIGKVIAVVNYGAGDILELDLFGKKSEMIPFDRQYVLEIDLKNHKMIVQMPLYLDVSPEEKEADQVD